MSNLSQPVSHSFCLTFTSYSLCFFSLPASLLRSDFAPPSRLEKLVKAQSFIPMSSLLICQGKDTFPDSRGEEEAKGGREVYTIKKEISHDRVSEVQVKQSKGEEMRARVCMCVCVCVCDSPSSAGEQRKDKQVKNTAGYHPSALESFSYTLPLISAELHTRETILAKQSY